MGGKNNGQSQVNSADSYYQSLANNSNALFQMYLPVLQQLLPELQSTVEGGPSPLMTAAQAPVNAQTARMMSTIQNNLGGIGNPNAMLSDIALNGQQQAGLSADQMLSQALSALQNLSGQGISTGASGLNGAAGGEANLGLNLNQQGNWLPQLLGAAGQAYAASQGIPTRGGGGVPGGGMFFSQMAQTPAPQIPMNSGDYFSMIGDAPAVAPNSNVSAPISSSYSGNGPRL